MQLKNISEIGQEEYRELVVDYCSALMRILPGKVKGLLVFGSVAKKRAKPLHSALSDVDLLAVVEDLPPLPERITRYATLVVQHGLPGLVQPVLMTPSELDEHAKARSGWVMDALHDGIVLYDPAGLIARARESLLRELKEKGVRRTEYGWVWPISAGEVVEL